MRPIEFRYRFKNRKTNQLITQIMDISSIENRAFWPNPFGSLEWEILSRDEFTFGGQGGKFLEKATMA